MAEPHMQKYKGILSIRCLSFVKCNASEDVYWDFEGSDHEITEVAFSLKGCNVVLFWELLHARPLLWE